jgi:hypothetical protein
MTFKDLQKLKQSKEPTCTDYSGLQGKPFRIWDQQQHRQEDIKTKGLCCFNHIIGLPQKGGHDIDWDGRRRKGSRYVIVDPTGLSAFSIPLSIKYPSNAELEQKNLEDSSSHRPLK